MKTHKFVSLIFVALLASVSPSFASIQVLMKIEGNADIPKTFSTQSDLQGFETYVEILSMSTGLALNVSPAGAGKREASTPSYSDFSISKWADEITPVLTFAAVSGNPISKITIAWVQTNTNDKAIATLMEFILEDVLVSGVSIGGNEGEERGTEAVSFNWSKMTIQSYTADSITGAMSQSTKVIIDAASRTNSK